LGVAAIIRERVIPAAHNIALNIPINRLRRSTSFYYRDLFLNAQYQVTLFVIGNLVLKLAQLGIVLLLIEKYYLNFRFIY
jgi:hypothetical protein